MHMSRKLFVKEMFTNFIKKTDSGTDVFLWIFQNFLEHHFYRTPLGDCFCDLLTPELFFELCTSQRHIQNFESNWKYSICIRVNNFAKSVHF